MNFISHNMISHRHDTNETKAQLSLR